MIVKSRFAEILRPELREIMNKHTSEFFDRGPRMRIDWSFFWGIIVFLMWGSVMYLMWMIHTLLIVGFGL